ncbi:MAG: DUF1295 domain-containing protein, partial [Lysobacteraceae bacterium]
MTPWQQVFLVWAFAALAQGIAWARQRRTGNAGIVDVVWSLCVGGAAVLVAATGTGADLPRTVLAVLGAAWGVRLGLHLWHRVRGEPEDGRYAHLRETWGNDQRKWFAMFQFQAVLVALFALPFLAVAANPVGHWTPWSLAGVAVWIGSVGGEALADRQLARFRADPANHGRTCRAGLWRYSRHPNYFFEWLHWFAYVLLAAGSPIGWLAWSGPLVM